MQTFRLTYMLDRRRISISGGAIAKKVSESKSDSESNLRTIFGVND